MDIYSAIDIAKLADENISYAQQYYEARKKSSIAKKNLDLILATKLPELRKKRSNIGYEMALIHLLEDGDMEIQHYYETFITETDHYKALERLIEAVKTKISFAQSVMKWVKENEGGL